MKSKNLSNKELGDFQTPPELVSQVIKRLSQLGIVWTRALEPTCGEGNFLQGLAQLPIIPTEAYAFDIQESYVQLAKRKAGAELGKSIFIEQKNIFNMDLSQEIRWKTPGPLLVLGNPPWVTNSDIGALSGSNLPQKTNIHKLRGMDAMTGASNFDISEYVMLKLIRELYSEKPTLAMICKTSVARNVLRYCQKNGFGLKDTQIYRIDATRWFSAATDACVFITKIDAQEKEFDAKIYPNLGSEIPQNIISFRNGHLISDCQSYEKFGYIDGDFPLVWRQGLKHDAADLVELIQKPDGKFVNKLGESVDIEREYLFPWLKSSDISKNDPMGLNRWIVVPQRKLGEDTACLAAKAPKLWSYLSHHKAVFDRRKSSIYKNQPSFAYFGLGDYTFSDYKVAISGMYKEPHFTVIGPKEEKPSLVDDTCYFVPCSNNEEAERICAILNSPIVQGFLKSISFVDSQRPYTKKILQRIDLMKAEKQVFPNSRLLFKGKQTRPVLDEVLVRA